ncbi:MAG: TatD family hydrolase [Candidatus Dojkabacteria bacterium]|nr:TatD family hydrolase [Candidatus Dojkabacteria bacterium]
MEKLLLIDHHCHIISKYYQDPIEIIRSNLSEGIVEIHSMGLDFDSSLELIKMKRNLGVSGLKIGVGIHPLEVEDLGDYASHEYDRVRELLERYYEYIDYIGEIGIDLKRSQKHKNIQIEIFTKMLELAITFDKPVSVHIRDSFDEVYYSIQSVLKKHNRKRIRGFWHCFTGTYDQGKAILDIGLKLGLSAIVMYPHSRELRETVFRISNLSSDVNEIFGLETDSPYLNIDRSTEKQNEPKSIIETKRKILSAYHY